MSGPVSEVRAPLPLPAYAEYPDGHKEYVGGNPLWQQILNAMYFFAALIEQNDPLHASRVRVWQTAFPLPCHDDRHSFWGSDV